MPACWLRIDKIFADKPQLAPAIGNVLAGFTLIDVDCNGCCATVHCDPALLRWDDFGCDQFGGLEFVRRHYRLS